VPYKTTQETCLASFYSNSIRIHGFSYCSNIDPSRLCTEDLVYSYLKLGPVAIAMDASNPDLQFYSGGIYDSKCSSVNHAVILIGYGIEKVGNVNVGYWIVRNSWTMYWGERGNIRIKHDESNFHSCGVTHSAFVPTLD